MCRSIGHVQSESNHVTSRRVVVLATSLRAFSKSRMLANQAMETLQRMAVPAELVDLRDYNLPFCDGAGECSSPDVLRLAERVRGATDFLIATPIYNYDVNSVAKNAVELLGWDTFGNKTVGFLAAAGGPMSYMAVMALANSMMLHFRCLILPRFVFATSKDFSADGKVDSADIVRRVELLVLELLSITRTEIPNA